MISKTRLLALFAIIAMILAACGGTDTGTEVSDAVTDASDAIEEATDTTEAMEEEADTTEAMEEAADTTEGEATADHSDVSVGLAFDIGGRGDASFNDSAAAGLDTAVEDFGIGSEELEPSGGGENREENLQLLSEAGSNLIFAIGFAFADGVANISPNFPDTSYAIVDAVVDQPNVTSLVFAEEQGSALVGCIAALTTETGQIGFIGGVENDLIKKFQAGYEFGANECNPEATVGIRYLTPDGDFSGFTDPAKGREAAVALYDGGADIIYAAAGTSGIGMFEEAAARKADNPAIWGIGVDSDQYNTVDPSLQGTVLTSMLKRVDNAVYNTISSFVDGSLEGGVQVFGLPEDGVGYSTSGDFIAADVITQVEDLKSRIIAADLEVPSTVG